MDSLRPSLSTSTNWTYLIDGQQIATVVNSDPPSHDPILPVTVSLLCESTTLAIYCTTVDPKPRWKWGGNVSALIPTGIMVGGLSNSVIGFRSLRLGELTIVRFPSLSSFYSLKFDVPYWFKSFYYSIWEYSGSGIGDNEGKIDQVFQEVKAINGN